MSPTREGVRNFINRDVGQLILVLSELSLRSSFLIAGRQNIMSPVTIDGKTVLTTAKAAFKVKMLFVYKICYADFAIVNIMRG